MIKFEVFYDKYMEQWSVKKRNDKICVIYPCTSEDMANEFAKLLNELNDEKERLKRINKGQELEIVRLHNLADTMSSVLRELGIYNVYDDETIEEVKNKLKGDAE